MKLSDAEWTVMNAVWDRAPASAREVLGAIGPAKGWAYSTVKTMLARLAEKGALRVSKRGVASVYEPAVSREEARRSALRGLLERAFDGTFGALVQHMVAQEKLSRRDREALAAMLEEVHAPPPPSAPGRRRR
jgi:predicted transcriptional regulator